MFPGRKAAVGILFIWLLISAGAALADNWSEWRTERQWRGFDYRNRCENGDDKNGTTFMWVQIRNRYQKPAHLNIGISNGTFSKGQQTSDRLDIRAGGTGETWYTVPTSSCGHGVLYTDKVRFGDDSGPYAQPQ